VIDFFYHVLIFKICFPLPLIWPRKICFPFACSICYVAEFHKLLLYLMQIYS